MNAQAVSASDTMRERLERLRDDVADTIARDERFIGHCYLCGDPCHPRSMVCAAHSWALNSAARFFARSRW